jgi:hypothetical protein
LLDLVGAMSFLLRIENSGTDARRAAADRHRLKAGFGVRPGDDFDSYPGRRRRVNVWSTFNA